MNTYAVFTQADLKKINQVRAMVEYHTGHILSTEIVGETVVFKWYISANDAMPFRHDRIHADTIKNVDWSMLTMLIMETRGQS